MPLTHPQHAVLTLWYLVNMSVSSYAKLIAQFGSAEHALGMVVSDWQALSLHTSHLTRFGAFIEQGRQSAVVDTMRYQLLQGEYQLVFYDDPLYPPSLKDIFDPPPLLFYQGNLQALSMPQLAIVGSRDHTAHASKIAFDMAQFLAYEGLWITSGMAEGIDTYAHQGALSQTDPSKQGRTVAVLGNGIRQCYPKRNLTLKQHIIANGGCVVTELLPDTPASKYTFPNRNRLVAGLSLATLVVEASLGSGSLITARLTNEQGKQVFAIPSHIDNVNAKGCHQLIREGATLIDHPMQILEDLAMFKSPFVETPFIENSHNDLAKNADKKPPVNPQPILENPTPVIVPIDSDSISPTKPPTFEQNLSEDIPKHLLILLNQLDWVGQDMDSLIAKTGLDIATLSGQLIELEIMGMAMSQAGLYLRCRL
ncbi:MULTISPECIES: DNA-processing protein DprA [unclassified Moraxella]|uniref:DNA-processing protein DprA n=1 Tax=unclassified Moraxella TaxID=2685852 RepID=UPI003AF6E73A